MGIEGQIADVVAQVFDNTLIPTFETAQEITVRNVTAGTYSTTTGGATDTTSDKTCNAAVSPYSEDVIAKSAGKILSSDRRVDVGIGQTNGPTAIDPDDKLLIDDDTYAIEAMKSISVGSTEVLWRIHARRQ